MEPLQSAVVSFLNLINLLLGSKAGVKCRMLLMCPGAGQDLLHVRIQASGCTFLISATRFIEALRVILPVKFC